MEAGLSLNQKANRYVIEGDEFRWPDQHDGNGGFDPELEGENIEKAVSINRNFHVEVPIQLNLYFKERGQGFYLHGGMRPGYGFGYKSKAIIIENGEQSVSTSESMSKPKLFSLMSRVGMGFAFPLKS